MLRVHEQRRQSRWQKMPRTRREQYNVLYRRARDVANKNLESIMRELFPHALCKGGYYVMSDIFTGGEGSMWVYRKGQKRGCFVDAGTPATERDKGDVIHLIAEKEFRGNTLEAVEFILGAYDEV